MNLIMTSLNYLSRASLKALKGVALLRLDFNTEDDWRVEAALPTIRFLLRHSSKVVIASHEGRPLPSLISAFAKAMADKNAPARQSFNGGGNGRMADFDRKLSLRKNVKNLEKFLKRQVCFVPHFHFADIKELIARSPRGSLFLLENLRFLKGETKNSKVLAKKLASLADFYVNDAFAVSHRVNASVVAITRFLPSYGGLELEKEIKFLSHALKKPSRPFVVLLGGGKAHDKVGVLQYFGRRADYLLLGGAVANTILFLKGVDIKKSVADRNPRGLKELRKVLKYRNLVLPSDFIFRGGAILDVGYRTTENFVTMIGKARTVVWSGPLGLIEERTYERGTLAVAKAIAKNRKAFSLAGGGETVMFLKRHGLDKKFSFISTGGGAMLDFLAGKKMPGIEALKRKSRIRR